MIPLDVLHAFAVASRSGRAIAVLGEADLEAEADAERPVGITIAEFASVAHPRSDRQRHTSLAHGLEKAFVICERLPGNTSLAAVRLDDGRKAVVLRHVAGDDAVERMRAAGLAMGDDELWTSVGTVGTVGTRP